MLEYKCKRCGRVHVVLGQAQVMLIPEADRVAIRKCFSCGAPASEFVPAQPGDAPIGSTMTPIVLPRQE